MMRLHKLPVDIMELIAEHLTMWTLRDLSAVCSSWQRVIQTDPVLAARINLTRAVAIFNAKGQLGLEFILSIGMVSSSPREIACWLDLPLLNPKEVGRVLGDKQNKPLLLANMTNKDFGGLHLDEALRKCLTTLQPSMTTSGMRRILKAFARQFCACNPHYFAEPEADAGETAYVLCFAMLTLNTDAHNSSVHEKMTKQQFVAFTASAVELKVKIPYLEGLYDRITTNEIRFDPDDGYFTGLFRSTFRWMSSLI